MRLFRRNRAAPPAPPASPAITKAPEPEARADSISGSMSLGNSGIMEFLGFGTPGVYGGGALSIEAALQVPAIWAAVNFYGRTLAALPIKIYEKGKDGARSEVSDHPAAYVFNQAAHAELTAFDWRQQAFTDFSTYGRHVSFLEFNGKNELLAVWPLEVSRLDVRRPGGKLSYAYRDARAHRKYVASEVIDLMMMPSGNGLSARSPIFSNSEVIGLALAVSRYGGRFFDKGGVPFFALEGPIATPAGATRAAEDMTAAIQEAAETGRNAIALPTGHKISPLGVEPEKMQMVEVKKYLVEEFARIWNLPPVFLQDLSKGTYSNTEQQDLHAVKHSIFPLVRKFEQQVNLKVFGPGARLYAEVNLDALARGALKDRAEALARQISTGQITPNEARRMDNRPDIAGGEGLYMQGAMMPIADLGLGKTPGATPKEGEGDDET